MLIHVLISHGVLRETGLRSGVSLVPRASSPPTAASILFSVHFSKSGARPRADLNRDRHPGTQRIETKAMVLSSTMLHSLFQFSFQNLARDLARI